jgi:hypothetical protein
MSMDRLKEIEAAVKIAGQELSIRVPDVSYVTYGPATITGESVAVSLLNQIADPEIDDLCGAVWIGTFEIGIAEDLGDKYHGVVTLEGETDPEVIDFYNAAAERHARLIERAIKIVGDDPLSMSKTTLNSITWDLAGDGTFFITAGNFTTGL